MRRVMAGMVAILCSVSALEAQVLILLQLARLC